LVSENIKMIRNKRDLSRKEFGRTLGVSATTVGKWENGISSPSCENIIEISKRHHVSYEDILDSKKAPKKVLICDSLPDDLFNLLVLFV